ncbi:MAG: NADH-quinone oxidoreductase subunit J [Myxococcota bacterium]
MQAFLDIPASFWLWAGFAIFTVAGGAGVAFSQNIVYSAFSLLATFVGMVALFAMMSADFLAVVQLMIYVGGILVVILFAVMLTNKIGEIRRSNPSSNKVIGVLLLVGLGALMFAAVLGYKWPTRASEPFAPTTELIGRALLGEYLLPFEIAGVMLLAALVAAVVVARKEARSDDMVARAEETQR